MNIFYLHHDVTECAKMHVDKHVVKMILETAQLLSTAHRFLDGKKSIVFSNTGRKKQAYILLDKVLDNNLYSATHINHPSAVWVRQSKANYIWLYNLFIALQNEYTFRYGKIHKSSFLNHYLLIPPKNIKNISFTQPIPAMDSKYIISSDSIINYRNYYKSGKTHLATWKNRQKPEWFLL